MIYQGNSISVSLLEDGIAKLNYDNQTESVNKFDQKPPSKNLAKQSRH